jgi:hypothetical protein
MMVYDEKYYDEDVILLEIHRRLEDVKFKSKIWIEKVGSAGVEKWKLANLLR